MLVVILEGGLLQFDGEVIELFSEQGKNDRFHIRFLEQIELEAGRKGITLMTLRYGKNGRSGFNGWIVPQENLADANALIEAVNSTKGN